jgi:hypothetical protein
LSYIGYVPAAKPLTSADITDGIITGNDIASTFDLTGKTVTLPAGTGGKVLQVVSTTKTDTFSQSSTTTFADITGLSVSITPSSASNKILVIAHIHGSVNQLSYRAAFRLVRGSTAIGGGTAVGNRQSVMTGFDSTSINYSYHNMAFNHLDSPATTSATTYKIQMITENTGVTGYINRSGSDDNTAEPYGARSSSTITVMEIAG